jgi:hypothetical protein
VPTPHVSNELIEDCFWPGWAPPQRQCFKQKANASWMTISTDLLDCFRHRLFEHPTPVQWDSTVVLDTLRWRIAAYGYYFVFELFVSSTAGKQKLISTC